MDRTENPHKHYPAKVDPNAPLRRETLPEMLTRATAEFKDKPCLDFLGHTLTYTELSAAVTRAARGLQSLGVRKGTRVGLFLPNTPYFVILYFAILKAGGIVVNVNPLYAAKEIEHEIKDAGIELMATLDHPQLYDKVKPFLGSTPLQRLIICRMADILPLPLRWLYPLLRRKEIAVIPRDTAHLAYASLVLDKTPPDPVAISPDDIAVLQYTGGTTGTPKGAMLTHENLTANVQQSRLWFYAAKDGAETMLAVLPLFHVFAMTTIMNLGLALGANIILLPKFDLAQLVKTIHRKKPTLFPAVPTIYTAINHFKDLARYDLSSIRYCISGGAPLPVEVKTSFERLTGCTLVEGYGLTESAPVACCNPIEGANKAGSIGLPLPQTRIEIVSLEDRRTILPQGERGEVCIRGPQVMRGYWNKPEETANVLRDGRLHTGDVGLIDQDGYVAITDRIKDMILASGYNVYPRIVEEAIYEHPAVEECAVAGIPDPYRGQTVKAWIRLKPNAVLDRDGLLSFLKDKLSPMELPKVIEFRQTPLPKTPIGKVSRALLLAEEMPPQTPA